MSSTTIRYSYISFEMFSSLVCFIVHRDRMIYVSNNYFKSVRFSIHSSSHTMTFWLTLRSYFDIDGICLNFVISCYQRTRNILYIFYSSWICYWDLNTLLILFICLSQYALQARVQLLDVFSPALLVPSFDFIQASLSLKSFSSYPKSSSSESSTFVSSL